MRTTFTRGRMLRPALALAAVGAVVVGLGGCAGGDAGGSGSGSSGGSATASGDCGTLPEVPPQDPEGIVAGLTPETQAGYNGYPAPVESSEFADFTGFGEAVPIGLSLGSNANSFTDESITEFGRLLELSSEAGMTTPEAVNYWAADVAAQSPAAQVAGYQDQVRQGAKLIVIVPLSGEALAPAVDEAGAQGVVTVVYAGSIPSKYAINVYQNPFLNVAQPTADVLKETGGSGNVLMVHGISSFPIDQQGYEAAKATIALCPDAKIAGEIEGGYVTPTAKTETLSWLTANPAEVSAVVQLNAMATGVITAFEQSGRTVPPVTMNTASAGDIAYLHDNAPDGYYAVGTVGGGASQLNAAFRVGMRVLAGQGPITNEMITAPPLITPDNVDDYYQDGWDINSAEGIQGDVFPDAVMSEFFTAPAELSFDATAE
jgi:ribose transport system substrate-binding protein